MIKLDLNTQKVQIENYLSGKAWITPDEKVLSIEKPGEGNMNVVLRITSNLRSFIVKQSRPYVQKYQQIEAPLERIGAEYLFYQAIQSNALYAHIPKVLGYDPANHVLLLEDLGNCEDMTALYQKREVKNRELRKLLFILGLIHRTKVPDFPENLEMRKLNHQHIFELPFMEDNGFSLDEVQPGLQELSMTYKKDVELKHVIKKIGKRYLSKKGNTLLHGDYYPGSWMTEANNLYVIDPEFGFVGFAEFDLGVMAAHLILATGKKKYLKRIHGQYEGKTDFRLVNQMAGIEMMRRLIGLAQLPMERTLEEKRSLLKKARKMILS